MTRFLVAMCSVVVMLVISIACQQKPTGAQKELPKESYVRPPEQSFSSSDYVFKLSQMESFYDVPGEFGHVLEGQKYGFEALSFIITETHPNGGPPLHTHESEEAHVLIEGKASYVIGDKRFAAEGPYIAKVPAGVPHTFINAGDKVFRLVAVFPSKLPTYKELGQNPLVKR